MESTFGVLLDVLHVGEVNGCTASEFAYSNTFIVVQVKFNEYNCVMYPPCYIFSIVFGDSFFHDYSFSPICPLYIFQNS